MSLEGQRPAVWPLAEGWNHEAGLHRLRQRGWIPRCIFDVGASNGAWTRIAAAVFPLAQFHLFEPLAAAAPGYKEGLDELARRRGLQVTIHSIALDNARGSKPMGVATDPMGSSMLATEANEWFPKVLEVETTTLDLYISEHGLPPPDLLKIDTQGAELRILVGSERTLAKTDMVLLETWLERGYGAETPLMHEVVGWLAERGFYVADTIGEYRERARLVSLDLLFARTGVGITSTS